MDIQNLSFENAMKELQKIIHTIENGSINLDNLVAQYELANKLHEYCSEKLKNAEMKIKNINGESIKKVENNSH